MKSCILKDIYNMICNGKSILLTALFFAVVFIPSSGAEFFTAMNTMIFSILIITTFSFDDSSGWFRYAVIMPVSRREIVRGKFIILMLFSVLGAVTGLIIGIAGTLILDVESIDGYYMMLLLFTAIVSISVSWILGSVVISIIFKFGSEKARLLMLTVIALPTLAIFCLYKIMISFGVVISEELVLALGWCSPAIALLWSLLMFKISCGIFEKKDL